MQRLIEETQSDPLISASGIMERLTAPLPFEEPLRAPLTEESPE